MIDSHCHLDHEPLLSDLPNVIQRSKDAGIKKLLTISTSFESEFYKVFGTLGMGILNGAAGLCFLMAFISFLPGVRAERNSKWNDLEIKRKELEKLRKEVEK